MIHRPTPLVFISSIILILATILSGCTQILVPAQPSGQEPVFPSETLITSLAAPTETSKPDNSVTPSPLSMESLVPTPNTDTTEVLSTATPQIDFSIPDAPWNADSDLWKQAYIDGMVNNIYIRTKVSGGLVNVYWDSSLNTLVWDLGSERFAFNQEFEFTGEITHDIFGGDWIVRKRLFFAGMERATMWIPDSLQIPGSNFMIMGEECGGHVKEVDIEFCYMIGQVVGKESLNLTDYLSSDFLAQSETETGILFDVNNLVFEFLKVRLPTSTGSIDFLLPICITGKCDTTANGSNTSGDKLLNSTAIGSMIYMSFTSVNDKMFVSDINQRVSIDLAANISRAFGFGEHLSAFVKRYFNIQLTGTPITYPDIPAPIFDIEKLVNDQILPFPAYIKIR